MRLDGFRILVMVLSTAAFLLIVQMFFFWLQSGGASRAATLVEHSSSYQKPRGARDVVERLMVLRQDGVLDCLFVQAGDRILVDETDAKACRLNDLTLQGAHRSWTLKGDGDQDWQIAFRIPNDRFFNLSLWFVRVGGVALLLLSLISGFYMIDRMNTAIQRVRLERDWLWHQARQVRHDVASPISALRLATGFPGLSPNFKDFLEKLLARTEEIFADLAQIPNGMADQEFRLDQVLADVVREKQNPRLSLRAVEAVLRGPRKELARALSNLIDNGLEASTQGLVSVDLTKDVGGVYIDICDHGSGFPKDLLLNGPRRGLTLLKKGGSGLGLYQAYNAIVAMGGLMTLKNRDGGRGARVTITLPNQTAVDRAVLST